MSPTIQLSAAIYKRLESHAEGFDTPESVVERLLNSYDRLADPSGEETTVSLAHEPILTRPEPAFYPSDIGEFKRQLLHQKQATRRITYQDGTMKLGIWNADRMDASSSVQGNINSGVLRDWKSKGIVRVEFAIDRNDLPANGGAEDLHLIEKMDLFHTLEDGRFTSGYWDLSEQEAAAWVGHGIFFHRAQAEPSHKGGQIMGYERASEGEYVGRIIFMVQGDEASVGVSTPAMGWQRWIKRV
jgi:hypothetical protein